MSGDGVMSDLSCRKAKPMCQSANACIHGETAEPSCLMPLIPAASLMHIIPPKTTLSQRPVRLAGVKGLLRVGGGLFKGGGRLFNGGGRVPWLAEVSFPPPSKEQRGEGGLLRGGGGFVVKGGGGGLLKGGGGLLKKGGEGDC